MDYQELIQRLRRVNCLYASGELEHPSLARESAAAIETLLAERDAAVEDLHGACRACVNAGQFEGAEPCSECTYGTGIMWDADNWQWRGPQKGDTQ